MQQVTELLKAAGEFLAGLGAVIAPIATVVIALHRKPEFPQYFITKFLFCTQFIVRIHIFFGRGLIRHKITLKGGHIILAVDRRLGSAP